MPANRPPQYLRIRDQLAVDIAQGVFASNKLPAERFACTRVTLREALQQLEVEGLVYRENRRGWFVAPPRIRYNPTRTTGFMEYVSAQGRVPRTETLLAECRPAGAWLAQRMTVAESDLVFFLQRRRWVDERPVLIELIALDASWCPGLLEHDLDTSLMNLLRERFGLVPARCQLAAPDGIECRAGRALAVGSRFAGALSGAFELCSGRASGRVRSGILASGCLGNRAGGCLFGLRGMITAEVDPE